MPGNSRSSSNGTKGEGPSDASRETEAGHGRPRGVFPAPRHKRTSRACSLRASARIEAVVRAGRRCWSKGGDERRRPPNRALLLSPTSARQRARRRTIGFVLRTTRGWRVLGRHSDRDRTSSAGPWWRARERLCIASRAFLHPAVPALHSAISRAGRRVARAGLRGPQAAPSLAPIHAAASTQPSKQTSAPARRRRRSKFCNCP